MSARHGRVLVVDDDRDVLLAARLLLKQHVEAVETESDPEKIPARIEQQGWDVILLDMNYMKDASSGREGFHWLRRIREIDPQAVVVFITAYGDVEMAVRAIKEGATDFVLKPWQNEKFLATVSAALSLRDSRREAGDLRSRRRQLSADLDQPYAAFIGESPSMRKVFDTIGKVADTDANVLILGENGTGKELAARELHRRSRRAEEVFLAVDMGSVSETLFESELFGHVKGAFTDARENRAGRFETASGGTLFLDEIGNLTPSLQGKILTVIENRGVTRLGSNVTRPIDVRLICASNMPLYDMVEQGTFRRDLLYRINTVVIPLPPLRERQGDIPLLARHFLEIYAPKYRKQIDEIPPDVIAALSAHMWPGNVRELRHAVERAVIMSESPVMKIGDIFPDESRLRGGEEEEPADEDLRIGEQELHLIRKAITAHGWNMSKAAAELGLSRPALYRRLKKYGL
jgi:two-component system, NtrC family, response regulator HydG